MQFLLAWDVVHTTVIPEDISIDSVCNEVIEITIEFGDASALRNFERIVDQIKEADLDVRITADWKLIANDSLIRRVLVDVPDANEAFHMRMMSNLSIAPSFEDIYAIHDARRSLLETQARQRLQRMRTKATPSP